MGQLLFSLTITILLILLLGALRTRLLFEFSAVSLLLFHSSLAGKWMYSLLFLPGTIIHELSHFLTAELLGVRTGEISILPSFDADSPGHTERLGSVATARSGPLRSFAIGAAPFIVGVVILSILTTLLLRGGHSPWGYAGIIYGLVVTGSSMLLSKEDRRSWPFMAVVLTLIVIFFYLTPFPIPPHYLFSLTTAVWSLNQIFILTLSLILLFIGISYGFRRIIEKVVKKTVSRS